MARFDNYYQANLHKNQLINEKNEFVSRETKYYAMISRLTLIKEKVKKASNALETAYTNYKDAYITSSGDKENRKNFESTINNIKGIYNRLDSYLIPGARNELSNITSARSNKENEINNIYYYNSDYKRYFKL